jgi:uncharacterized membrane protein
MGGESADWRRKGLKKERFMAATRPQSWIGSAGRYIVIGLVTLAPLGITWLLLDFLFGQLSRFGRPWVSGFVAALRPHHPEVADLVVSQRLQEVIAAIVVLALLFVLGWGTTRMLGQRLIGVLESLIGRIPLVDSIYRSSKQFLKVASIPEGGERRVVLVNFPSPEMKALGLVTRTIKDTASGEELAIVYVPTSPNPTSGCAM